jgi:ABC-type cobalamin/Fe3+-siderophores transport system ATPase subunit
MGGSLANKRKLTFGRVSKSVGESTSSQGLQDQGISTKTDLQGVEVLPEYLRVEAAINQGQGMILVTGGAGTGKSTLIKWLQNKFAGAVIVAAPTGIAALTIGGKTIHSICGFPPAWLVANDIRLNRKSPVSKADLLIIDEVSMVNANLLDAMSDFFKLNRGIEEPFGGMSVVMVGDLFQLPPIINKNVKHFFQEKYTSPKFFAAEAIRHSEFEVIELTKAFRQTDQSFVDLLADIREGKNLERALRLINERSFGLGSPIDGTVWLAPRNADVDRVNQERLAALPGPDRTYSGILRGDFKESHLPVPGNVKLRVGAQVVLANNTANWVNGSVAMVHELLDDSIRVVLSGQTKVHEVAANTWEQFDYVWNSETESIERVVIGTYTQLPVHLAWAMTIHRSQGLTLDRVHLELGRGSFETGQTYVALSRCRSLENITISRQLEKRDILVDPEATAFYKAIRE